MAMKRPENLMPGDRVKVWGDDLTVESAEPSLDRLKVRVTFSYPDTDSATIEYPAGVLVETAED
jgi:hypothetical protein